jgi:hypothetical protein
VLIFNQYIRTLLNSNSAVKKNKASHISNTHEHQDIRWKPNVGENHLLLSSLSSFNNKKIMFTILYWCRLIPVRRLLPAEGYNLLSFSSFYWKGATTPLVPVSAGRLQLLKGLTLILTADHISLIFTLDHAVSSSGYDSNINYLKSKHINTNCQAVTKGNILNNSINLEKMPLISGLEHPQLSSFCQCRSAVQLPQGGSSFFKPAMLPPQMTSPTSRYPCCQKMASASSFLPYREHRPPF